MMLREYSEALRGFRPKASAAVVLFGLSGIAESAGIGALLPFLEGSLADTHAVGQPTWFGLEGRGLAICALGVLVVLGTTAAVLRYLADERTIRVQTLVEQSLRARITAALFQMRWTAYLRLSLGDATKSVLVEGAEIGRGVQAFISGLGNALIAAVFLIVAAAISLPLTLAILAFGCVGFLVYRAAGRRAGHRGTSLSAQSEQLSEMTTETFGNAKYHRSTGHGGTALADSASAYARWRDELYRVLRYQPIARVSFDLAGIVFIAGILAFAVLVAGAAATEAIVLVALFYRLGPRLQAAQQGLLAARAQEAWWRSWKQRYDGAVADAEHREGGVVIDRNPRIALEGVSFVFPGRTRPAVSSLSFTVDPGECLAIVGESGSGKTTTLDLISGLLEPASGTIHLDGINLEEVDLEAWQRRIGLVMQDAPLFYGSILENIAWGDRAPDEAKAMRCAALANASGFIGSLPDGLETPVGHGGGRVSGGQRQRIALARALYRDPWLLLLDEATSALDARSERAIQQALRSLRHSCSILLVAHRLKTVELADRILVLSHGRITEEGTWAELVARGDGEFRRMVRSQEPLVPVLEAG
jgi:ABC-type multidrug transport system fused ATPase/permease subunit